MTTTMPVPILKDWITLDPLLVDLGSICRRLALLDVPSPGTPLADALASAVAELAPRLLLDGTDVVGDPPVVHLRLLAAVARRSPGPGGPACGALADRLPC